MKTKDGIFETDPLSKKIISGETISVSVGSNDKEQSSSPDLSSYRGNGLPRNYDFNTRNSFGKFEQKGSKTKYPFIVDWQIPETL